MAHVVDVRRRLDGRNLGALGGGCYDACGQPVDCSDPSMYTSDPNVANGLANNCIEAGMVEGASPVSSITNAEAEQALLQEQTSSTPGGTSRIAVSPITGPAPAPAPRVSVPLSLTNPSSISLWFSQNTSTVMLLGVGLVAVMAFSGGGGGKRKR